MKTKSILKHGMVATCFLSILFCLSASTCSNASTEEPQNTFITKTPNSKNTQQQLEIPTHPNDDQIVKHHAYTLSYDEDHEQPRWVAYMITRQRTYGQINRSNDFRPDPDVKTQSAQPSDYRGSGYTRGHLAPAGDMKWDTLAMSECFLLSNMSPQDHDFNDGIWNKIEKRVRYWARKYDTLYIATGPVLTPGLKTIGHGVSVPEYFYKVILDPRRKEGIGFVVPHHDIDVTLPKFVVTIDSVERLTGIDFFPALPDNVEESIESKCNVRSWSWK